MSSRILHPRLSSRYQVLVSTGILSVLLLVCLLLWWSSFQSSATMTIPQRQQFIASQLKCPVCQGESVADSSATIAVQMRAVIAEKLAHGSTDQQILAYFTATYGTGILLAPPVQGFSALAWLIPILVFSVALLTVSFRLLAHRTGSPNPLTPLEDEEGE